MVSGIYQQPVSDIRRAMARALAIAATDKGFIRLIGWFRFVAVLLLTIRFAWGTNEAISQVIPYALWFYFLATVFFRLLADFSPRYFDTPASRFAQVIVDLGFVTLFYYASGDLKSDIFQLYILPLLIVARYANRVRVLVGFLIAVMLATLLVWSSFSVISPQDFDSPHVWLFRLLSRVGFLALFVMFYTIYQRRQRLTSNLQLAMDEVLQAHHQIRPSTFSVDRQLRITGLDENLQARYGNKFIGKPYFQVFCPNAEPPPRCPVAATIRDKNPVSGVKVIFAESRNSTYPVELSTTPIFSKRTNVIGVTVTICPLQEREAFEDLIQTYAANVEFAIDAARLDYQSWAADKTRQLNAITEATAAALLPDHPLGVKRILQRMAELLRCQVSDLRLFQTENDRPGLVLKQAYGYDVAEGSEWRFVETDSTSIVARAFAQQQPIQVYDVQREPQKIQYISKANLYGLRSMAAFPLTARDQLIGTVSMYRQRRLAFSEDELELGQAFANSLAATLFNQQLVEQGMAQAELQASQVTALSEISRELPVRKDVAILANLITNFTKVHLHAEVAALFLLEEGHLYRKAITGVANEWFREETYATGQGLTGQVVCEAELVCVNDVDTNKKVIHEHLQLYQQKLPSGQVKHLLAVPLIGQDGLIGVLRVLNKLDSEGELNLAGFTQYDRDLLTIISHSVAVSIQATRYAEEQEHSFNQQRQRASSLLKLNNRTAEFTATTDYRQTLTQIALGLRDLLNCDIAGLGINDRRTGEIRALPDCGIVGVAPELATQLRFAAELSGGEVLRSRKIHKTADTQTDSDSIFGQALPTLVNARAIIAIPLYVGERDVGILYGAQCVPRHFSKEEEQLCEIYARQAAVAIRNTELLEELNRRVATLENLRKSALSASERDDLPEVLRIIAEGVNQAVGADISFIAPFSTTEDRLDIGLSVTAGNDGNYIHPPRIREHGLTRETLDSPEGYFIVEDYAEFPPQFASDFVTANNITSAIGVRLEFKKDIVGILYVNFYDQHHFSDENIETLRLLAVHVAMAIHTFNLMRRNKEIAKERERERLREDMHSVLGSFHSRIMFGVERIRKQIETLGNSEHLAALDRLWDSSSFIYRQLERILNDMRDPILAERGLTVALEGLRLSHKNDLAIDLQINGDCKLSPDVELALYRITQECIHNIIKHASIAANQANGALIRLDLDSPIPRLIIQDFGQGFDVWKVKQANNGMGLKLIENWARKIQAMHDIKSEVGGGTIVNVNILQKEAKITQ